MAAAEAALLVGIFEEGEEEEVALLLDAVAFGVDISDEAFCEMADRAPAAILALAWALEAIVFAFLNWLDGK